MLTIDKAIEILSDPEPDIDGILNDDYKDAVKLGIEAIVKLQDIRARFPILIPDLLPGEEPQ
jgi:hypothetical protein